VSGLEEHDLEWFQRQIQGDSAVSPEGNVKVDGKNEGEFPVRQRASKYPWDKWFVDGQINVVYQDEDFHTSPETFRVTVTNTAKRKGWKFIGTSVTGPKVAFFVTNDGTLHRKIKYGEYED
jgi:hypothetical protein